MGKISTVVLSDRLHFRQDKIDIDALLGFLLYLDPYFIQVK